MGAVRRLYSPVVYSAEVKTTESTNRLRIITKITNSAGVLLKLPCFFQQDDTTRLRLNFFC